MTSATNEDSPVGDWDFQGRDKFQFEERLREEVRKANAHFRGDGKQSPWEVIMEAVIALKHDMER